MAHVGIALRVDDDDKFEEDSKFRKTNFKSERSPTSCKTVTLVVGALCAFLLLSIRTVPPAHVGLIVTFGRYNDT